MFIQKHYIAHTNYCRHSQLGKNNKESAVTQTENGVATPAASLLAAKLILSAPSQELREILELLL